MKKFVLFLLLLFSSCIVVFAQSGSVEIPSLVAGYANNEGISSSVGQVFDALAPEDTPISILTEGIQQGEQSACEDITEVTDIDNNTYPAVDLGLYCWTGKNLKTRHYANGDTIYDIRTYISNSYTPPHSEYL